METPRDSGYLSFGLISYRGFAIWGRIFCIPVVNKIGVYGFPRKTLDLCFVYANFENMAIIHADIRCSAISNSSLQGFCQHLLLEKLSRAAP